MRARHAGAALVFVLLIVAVLAIVAVQINEQLRFNSKRLDNQRQNDQAYWYSLGGEALAISLLEDLASDSRVHLGQSWATRDAIFPIEDGWLQGQIVDAQACFNLNNLYVVRNPGEQAPLPGAYEKQFVGLLAEAGLELQRAEQLRDAVQDWLDPDQLPQGNYGAEDLTYTDRAQAYQAANQLISDISELLLLMEFSQEEVQSLLSNFCALPASATAMNINTLTRDQSLLLSAAVDFKITETEAQQLLESRPKDGWESVEQFLAEPLLTGREIPEDFKATLAVQSGFFRATINVVYRDSRFSLISLLGLANKKATVLSRQYGELF